MDYWKRRFLDSLRTSRVIFLTMLIGITLNFAFLSLSDESIERFDAKASVFFSLIIGYIIAKVWTKMYPPTAEDVENSHRELPPDDYIGKFM